MKTILFLTRSLGIAGVPIALVEFIKLLDCEKNKVIVGIISDCETLKNELPQNVQVINIYKNPSSFFISLKKLQSLLKKRSTKLLWKLINQIEKFYEIKLIKKNFKMKYDYAVAFHQGICTKYVYRYIKSNHKIMFYHSSVVMPDCKQKWFKKAEKIVLGNPLVLNVLKEKWKKIKTEKIISIPPLINIERIEKLCREEINDVKKTNMYTVCTVTRLTDEKGIDLLNDIANELANKNFKFRWIVVGSGPLMRIIDKNKNIIAVGHKINPYPYLMLSDLYVSTSLFECYGLSLTEARFLGLNVLATKTLGSLFQLANEKNNLCNFDAKEIANKIIENSHSNSNKTNFVISEQKKYASDFLNLFGA